MIGPPVGLGDARCELYGGPQARLARGAVAWTDNPAGPARPVLVRAVAVADALGSGAFAELLLTSYLLLNTSQSTPTLKPCLHLVKMKARRALAPLFLPKNAIE